MWRGMGERRLACRELLGVPRALGGEEQGAHRVEIVGTLCGR
jgi:hypothetical protein